MDGWLDGWMDGWMEAMVAGCMSAMHVAVCELQNISKQCNDNPSFYFCLLSGNLKVFVSGHAKISSVNKEHRETPKPGSKAPAQMRVVGDNPIVWKVSKSLQQSKQSQAETLANARFRKMLENSKNGNKLCPGWISKTPSAKPICPKKENMPNKMPNTAREFQ